MINPSSNFKIRAVCGFTARALITAKRVGFFNSTVHPSNLIPSADKVSKKYLRNPAVKYVSSWTCQPSEELVSL